MQANDTALHYAAAAGNLEIVETLVEQYGADPTLKNNVCHQE